MSNVITINPAPTEALPLYLKRAAEKELNYGPAVFTVASAADLRAIPTAACYEGLIVILRFLLDVRDFGGGAFVWKPADTTPDNNGTAIIPTDNESGFGCWRRQESLGQPGYINIKWFGAIPFLKGFDNAPIINAAIQTLPRFAPAYSMPINGGSMRLGTCFIPAGEWYLSDTIVASGSMTVRGDGSTATTLTLNDNCQLFDGVPVKTITSYTRATQSTIGGRPMVWAFPVARITFSTPHGYTPGEQISGMIDGLGGNDAAYHMNGRWYRFHALNSTQVEFLDFVAAMPSSLVGATIEFEKFILDFQWTEGNVADNDVFGTQCRSLSIVGAALTNNQNARSSGLYILGAQDSIAEDIRVWTVGIRGVHLAVPGNRIGVANIVRGPGIYTTMGYLVKHGTMHSEHVNQQALHYISDVLNTPVPRAAFMITNCFHARFTHIQGENSPLEVHIRNSSNIYLGDVAMNAAGVNQVFNGYPHTIFHFSGDTRTVLFEGSNFTTGSYVHTARDMTTYAIQLGIQGWFEDLAECSARTGWFTKSPIHTILLGPYVDDAQAAKFGVPWGATYKQLGGIITWRQLYGPFANDAAAAAGGVDLANPYITTSWTIVNRAV